MYSNFAAKQPLPSFAPDALHPDDAQFETALEASFVPGGEHCGHLLKPNNPEQDAFQATSSNGTPTLWEHDLNLSNSEIAPKRHSYPTIRVIAADAPSEMLDNVMPNDAFVSSPLTTEQPLDPGLNLSELMTSLTSASQSEWSDDGPSEASHSSLGRSSPLSSVDLSDPDFHALSVSHLHPLSFVKFHSRIDVLERQ